MPGEVVMPQMGESIAEGTVTTWLKKVGDHVSRDEPLFEISTDKVDAEIPSPVEGVLLEIRVQPGQSVPVGSVVAIIGDASAAVTAAASAPAPAPAPTPAAAPTTTPAPAAVAGQVAGQEPVPRATSTTTAAGPERAPVKSSPLVRKIAKEHNIDVSQVRGTGIGARVTKQDILAHIQQGNTDAAPFKEESAGAAIANAELGGGASQAGGLTAGTGAMLAGMVEVPESYRGFVLPGDRVEEMSTMRAKIAEHMVLSRRISAHVATVFDVDFSRVAALRSRHKALWEERFGTKLTYTGFIMKAAVDAIKAFPQINASIDGRRVIYHRDINLGLAVALDWGLIVPVIHQAGELNLLGLARRANELAERARSKKLKPEEVRSGTFTITNPGVFGSLFGLPVINQPQVAIMGVGTVEKRPVVENDMIGMRTKAYLSLSFDHRLVDGATADQFMARVKKGIEEFDEAQLG